MHGVTVEAVRYSENTKNNTPQAQSVLNPHQHRNRGILVFNSKETCITGEGDTREWKTILVQSDLIIHFLMVCHLVFLILRVFQILKRHFHKYRLLLSLPVIKTRIFINSSILLLALSLGLLLVKGLRSGATQPPTSSTFSKMPLWEILRRLPFLFCSRPLNQSVQGR